MKRKKRNKKNAQGILVALALIALASFAGLAAYVRFSPAGEYSRMEKTKLEVIKKERKKPASKRIEESQQVYVPRPFARGGSVEWTFEIVQAQHGVDPLVLAVNRFLESSKIASNAKLLEVRYRGENAELEFENLFYSGYGTDDEQTLLKGILIAVSENSKAKTVTFYENGKLVRSLGNIELEIPQPVR